ncbi:MAG TPA: DUF2971 domain-containing protein [Candidatus Saccharimonadales bacterium]|nr:DUF2971 domain-containing protein [Candidatus Saccharimonadales bacterium]
MAFIYKYFKASNEQEAMTRMQQVVEQHSLYATPPKEFNDPFEFKVWMICDAPEHRISAQYFNDNPTASFEEYEVWKRIVLRPNGLNYVEKRIREDLLNALGVICLTLNPDNSLMWSHYGPDHLSFCAAFDRDLLLETDRVILKGRIHYCKSLRGFNYFTQRRDTFVKTALFSKSDCWMYEEEYRLVLDKQGIIAFPENALKGIILGCRAYPGLRRYAQENVDKATLWYEQMVESSRDYRLLRCPIEKDVYWTSSHF